MKFLATGCVGITVNLSVFHISQEYLQIPYLIGSVMGLGTSMVVGFLLQKFWTFEQKSANRMSAQFFMYASLALFNLSLNTGIVFLLVEIGDLHYLLSQAAGAGTVAIISFFAYREVIFRGTSETGSVQEGKL